MSYIAEVSFTHPRLHLGAVLESLPEIVAEIKPQPVTDLAEPTLFYSVTNVDTIAFESVCDETDSITDWNRLLDVDETALYRMTTEPDVETVSSIIADLRGCILDARSYEGVWKYLLYVSDRDALTKLTEYCDRTGITFQLNRLYSVETYADLQCGARLGLELTDRQREVATTAATMGYFDSEGADAGDVADELDISQSALSGHLRLITNKIYGELFVENPRAYL
ncbi:helix-turn-helix domain-containing protein [Natronococcus wangiae]|uniref:helix-turn-helix domain-containing protein n=1 Tax=Natronococcus wangiae TaxID=3068275 RepID=UPI00273FFB4C|nr:helix-turn-helix domain-containing protein [Natronococcus sp. AD5]